MLLLLLHHYLFSDILCQWSDGRILWTIPLHFQHNLLASYCTVFVRTVPHRTVFVHTVPDPHVHMTGTVLVIKHCALISQ